MMLKLIGSRLVLILCAIWSILSAGGANSIVSPETNVDNSLVIQVVYDLDDITPSADNCVIDSANSQYCNLRSAWLYCCNVAASYDIINTNGYDSCRIVIPENLTTVEFNQVYGPLVVPQNSSLLGIDLYIQGAKNQIISNGEMSPLQNVISRYEYITQTEVKNYTISNLFPGEILTLQCEQCTGDMFLRVYDEFDEMVAFSDDYLGVEPALSYTVPGDSSSGLAYNFRVEVGCTSIDATEGCSGVITQYNTAIPAQRFLFGQVWTTTIDNEANPFPIVDIQGLQFEGFGNPNYNGGVIYVSDGKIQYSFRNCTFKNNQGWYGGAVFVNSLSRVTVSHVDFTGNQAQNGGALYIDKLLYNLELTYSSFVGNTAAVIGGAVYMNTLNSILLISNCSFDSNRADAAGGAIYMYQQNSAITMTYTTFNGSQAVYGACICIDMYNQQLTFDTLTLSHSTSTSFAAGMYFNQYTSGVVLNNVIFDHLHSDRGAAMYVVSDANLIQVQNCIFSNLTANYFAGLYVTKSTELYFTNNVFIENRGTTLYFDNGNSRIYLLNNRLENIFSLNTGAGFTFADSNRHIYMESNYFYNVSGVGGGPSVRVYHTNLNVTLFKNTYINCYQVSDEGEGGVISIDSNNRDVQVLQNYFDTCYAELGGCINIGTNNTKILFRNVYFTRTYSRSMAGSIFIVSQNVDLTFDNVSVYNSAATDGGGIVIIDNNQNITFSNCNFVNNTALGYGGVMLIGKINTNIVFQNLLFRSNKATYGGAIAVLESNQHFTFSNVSWYDNDAKLHGGAVYFMNLNKFITFESSYIINNTAIGYGGGVMLNKTNDNFTFAGCQLQYNQARYGGALYEGYNNQHTILTDLQSYQDMVVDQFIYHEVVFGTMYNRTITSKNAIGYIISFAFANYEETQSIELLVDHELYETYAYYSNFPGISKPSLYVKGSSIQIVMIATDEYGSDDPFGFGYLVIPVTDINTVGQGLTTFNQFSNNRATYKGGAIYTYSNSINFFVSGTIFDSNFAKSGGGGLFMQLVQTDTLLVQNSINNNQADASGGGIALLAGCYGIQFIENSITNNVANDNGGGLYIGTTNGQGLYLEGNEVSIQKNNITENRATDGYGGGFYCDNENIMISQYNTLASNYAGINGGAFYVNSLNDLALEGDKVFNNAAKRMGGGFYSASQNTLELISANFSGNHATDLGGGMVLDDQTSTLFQGYNIVTDNYAYFGGGIAALTVDLWQVGPGAQLWIYKNTASRGSGLFCYPLVSKALSTNSLKNISFQGNIASAGGTVYWLKDDVMLTEPSGLQSSTINWNGNTAGYGTKWATQATKMNGPTVYEVEVYDSTLSPSIVFTMSDYYNQSLTVSNDTEVFATLLTDSVLQSLGESISKRYSAPDCVGSPPSLSGDDMSGVTLMSGMATFSRLQAYCTPGGNFSVQFQAKLGSGLGVPSQLASTMYISTYSNFNFRNCYAGEFTKNGMCVTCAKGTYNLQTSDDIETCNDCTKTEGVDTCYSNQIVVEKGYWRRYPGNTAVMKCLLSDESCIGGNMTGQALCATGYTGPLCAVCDNGYYLNENKCDVCKGDGAISTTLVVVIVLLCSTVVGIAAYYYLFVFGPVDTLVESWMYQSFTWIKSKYADATSSLKIVVATYQIVTSVGSVFSITMPIHFTSFMKTFKIFNVSMSSLFPLGCSPDFDFMDTLFWTTMSPILFVGVIVMVFVGEYYYWHQQIQSDTNRQKGAKRAKFEEIKNKYLNYIFYVTYLILPSVTTTIFQLFICQNIDPNSEDSTSDDYFLTADMTISCSSDYYKQWLIYGAFMIIIYPIGIPMMYLGLLYQNRQEIENRGKPAAPAVTKEIAADDKAVGPSTKVEQDQDGSDIIKQDNAEDNFTEVETDTNTTTEKTDNTSDAVLPATVAVTATAAVAAGATMSASANRLQFLWKSYEPQFWYWEVIETFRRIMLTAVISVIKPGTSEQNLVSIILAVGFMKLYSTYHPYANARNDVLAELGQLQIFFTFLCALTINNDLLNDTYEQTMDALLLILNLNVTFFVIYHLINGLVERNGGWNKVLPLLSGALVGGVTAMYLSNANSNANSQDQKNNNKEKKTNQDTNLSTEYDVELTTFSNNPLHSDKKEKESQV